MREKGVQTKCYLCGCEIETILEAAHLWGVAEIKKTPIDIINNILQNSDMNKLIDQDNKHHNEQFYKRYVLANSGDNGIWLCSNHHGLFDSNYYCFDSKNGKVLVKLNADEESKIFFDLITSNKFLPSEILTERTKLFLSKRQEMFEKINK